jgi:3-phenylpropionate/trans-cinnamate dioxygenase ferredoxin reductase subunit
MLETAKLPLLRAFGPEIGAIYEGVHRSHGVDLRCGVEVASFRGETHVEEVITTAGDAIRCDFVVAGIGVTPATRWLEGSGIPLDPATGAVIVDERGRSEVPGIWAAGDVASAWDATLERRVCVESIDNAMNQAAVVASNLTGRPSVHGGVPFFWSDQYDLKLQSVGHIGPYERAVVRGSIEERAFVVFHMVGAEVRFVIAVNRMKEIAGSKKLIAGRVACSDQALADESIPIASLLPPAP